MPEQMVALPMSRKGFTTESQEVLGRFYHLGFRLEAPDDHILVLLFKNKPVAVFSQTGATPRSIQNECASRLVSNYPRYLDS